MTYSIGWKSFSAALTAGVISFVISNLSYMRRPVNIFGNPAGSLIFGGFWFVYLFFVGASAIYSLIKSPVPDAASPVHGYSRSMAYARGFYLISLSCLLFLLIFIESNIQEIVLKVEIRNSRDFRKTRFLRISFSNCRCLKGRLT